jgi:hypothetical protein
VCIIIVGKSVDEGAVVLMAREMVAERWPVCSIQLLEIIVKTRLFLGFVGAVCSCDAS